MTNVGKHVVKDFIFVNDRDTSGSLHGFIDAVTVWINKPHVVNRRLSGAEICSFIITSTDRLQNTVAKLQQFMNDEKHNFDKCNYEHGSTEIENLQAITENEAAIIVRKLISKQPKNGKDVTELIILESTEGSYSASFYPVIFGDLLHTCPYQLSFVSDSDKGNRIQLKKLLNKKEESDDSPILDWMVKTLLPKLCNWSAEAKLKTSVTSLRLLPIEEYSQKYTYLKEKYGKYFVENWPESTDPQKFVYEDVAIAAYLLVLWKREREKKQLDILQSFVDLGCGNGLLVHILSSEGHPGIGLDIRKRKIWNMFGKETVLKEVTITPSADNTFPDYDWLIGNHSDELTPWIPVIAARSSFNCRYFVLPCCHFDFDCKFSSRHQGQSNYRTYLNFVKEVGEVCGFKVEEDTLRIPSTKRVCFIGQDRTYSQSEEEIMDDKRSDYIKTRSKRNQSLISVENSSDSMEGTSVKFQKLDNGEKWSPDFEPRELSKEKSRNCQHIDKDVKNHIIHTVFNKVLDRDRAEVRHLADGRTWTKGGTIPLGDVVKLFGKDTLKQLKSECGGLQTLLKNHNNIFNVCAGSVQLRDLSLDEPFSKKSQLSKKDRSQYFKTLPCWFFLHHPDGCPRTQATCTFAHGDDDLKFKVCDKKLKTELISK